MPLPRSESGNKENIAQELAEGERNVSISDFFRKNKHMLGFDSGARALVTAVQEALDNALEACEEADILPDVHIEIQKDGEHYRLIVEDNGPGITEDQIPKIFGKFLYGPRFHKREQSRGQKGSGISAAVLYSQLTSGKPVKITTRTQGSPEARYFELFIDTDTNQPEISEASTTSWDRSHGTRIEIELEANMRNRTQLHEYVKYTAVANPHARLEFREPGLKEPLRFERATDQLPAQTTEIRPHPHGIELGTLLKMLESTESSSISGFLQSEFTRVGRKTANRVCDNLRDRHFGRELGWSAEVDAVKTAISEAVANKDADATEFLTREVAARLASRERTSHHELIELIDELAETAEEEFGVLFSDTVRENVVEAVWATMTIFDEEAGVDALSPDLRPLVDEATSNRKDDDVITAISKHLARRFAASDDRTRFARDDLERLVNEASDDTEEFNEVTFKKATRENVVEVLWNRMVTVPDELPEVRDVAADRDIALALFEAMRETDILSPPTDCLAPITSDLVEVGLRKEFDAEFYTAITRDAEVHSGDPFVVEAGLAHGGKLNKNETLELLRFANRVPLVYQEGACAITDVVKSIDWGKQNLGQTNSSELPHGPAAIMVHVASTNVPFTSESKDAIANVPEIEKEVEIALKELNSKLQTYLNEVSSNGQSNQNSNSVELGAADGRETRELVHFVTQQTRFALINNILQHPKQLPSMYELEELNPSVSEATVYKHIQKLINAGIVKEVALDDDQRQQGYPWKFYGLTEEGRTFLEKHNLLAAEETLQQIYETISDKPEKMVKYENAPRPGEA